MPRHPALPQTLDVDLTGLSAAAAPWLATLPVADQRISAAPDSRTIRYYQSTGLLDRPLRYDGRVARYGRRHLLQLLATRALQSLGLSLAQVQTALSGATDAELLDSAKKAFNFGNEGQSGSDQNEFIDTDGEPAIPTFRVRAAPSDSPLAAIELAPGIVVTIDSRIRTDTTRVLELLRRALQGELT